MNSLEGLSKKIPFKPIFAATIGGALEYYDFLIWGFLAPFIAPIFFPSEDPLISILSAYGAFAAGFLMRPLGGIFFGFIGDRYGRKKAMTTTLFCMGTGTLLIGISPTYETIGLAAPVLVIVGRLLQGFSLGGELAGSLIFAFEHTQKDHRALAVSFVASGNACGGFIGSFACLIFTLSCMPVWGWRVPFILGFFVSLIGFYIRQSLLETPEFTAIKTYEIEKNPLGKSLSNNPLQLLIYFLFSGIGGALYYINFVYLITFAKGFGNITHSAIQLYCALGIGAAMISQPFLGALADRKGVYRFMSIGLLSLIAITILRYMFISSMFVSWLPLCISILAGIAFATFLSGWYPYSLTLFDKKVRYSSAASASSAGLSLIAGTAPLLASYLMGFTHGHLLLLIYLLLLGSMGLAGLWMVFCLNKINEAVNWHTGSSIKAH